MYTKTIQNTKFVYILYAMIVQIKISDGNECTRNVHQIPKNIPTNSYILLQKVYKLYKT